MKWCNVVNSSLKLLLLCMFRDITLEKSFDCIIVVTNPYRVKCGAVPVPMTARSKA